MASGSTIVNATYNSSGSKVCDALKFSWWENSQSVASNTTNVGWKLELISYEYGYINSSASKNWSVTVNGQKYSGTNTIGISKNSTKTLASGTTTITHNDDGTKSFSYSFSQDFKITFNTYVGTKSGSGTGTLTTITRETQPNLSNPTAYFGETITIFTPRASTSFTHEVWYEFGSLSGTIGTSVTDKTTWTIPLSLMNEIPDSTSGSGRIYVDTYNGSTLIGTKYSGFTATVPSTIKPTCTCTLTDTTGVDDIYGSPVKGLSKIKFTVSATTADSSPIRAYSVSIDGVTYSVASATTGFLVNSGTSKVSVSVTDNRGRVGTWSYNMSVQDYARPVITKLSVIRCNQNGTANKRGAYLKATFSAAVSSMDGKNTASYSIKYKKTADSSYTTVKLTALANNFAPTNKTYIFAASANSYDVVISAWDRHSSSSPTTKAGKGASASAIFSWRGFKNSSGTVEEGAGIGKTPEKPNTLQVGWDAEFDNSVRGKVFGLGTLALIPNGSNLNDYVVPGVYSIATDASAATIANMPKQTAGRLIISDSTGKEPSEDFELEYKEQLFLPRDIGRGGVPWVRQIRRQKSSQWTYYDWHTYGLFAYPVGAIYISYNHDNPATLFGGTWERIENRFLWATTPGGTIGQTGGEQTHTLTVDELPNIHGKMQFRPLSDGANIAGVADYGNCLEYTQDGGASWSYGINYTSGVNKPADVIGINVGKDNAHNNMPPYIQVSIWRRTA